MCSLFHYRVQENEPFCDFPYWLQSRVLKLPTLIKYAHLLSSPDALGDYRPCLNPRMQPWRYECSATEVTLQSRQRGRRVNVGHHVPATASPLQILFHPKKPLPLVCQRLVTRQRILAFTSIINIIINVLAIITWVEKEEDCKRGFLFTICSINFWVIFLSFLCLRQICYYELQLTGKLHSRTYKS